MTGALTVIIKFSNIIGIFIDDSSTTVRNTILFWFSYADSICTFAGFPLSYLHSQSLHRVDSLSL